MEAIGSIFSSLFGIGNDKRDHEIHQLTKVDHTYKRLDIAYRAPCPGLNALTNQGYLPRDGKNITLPRLEAALMTALHMSGTVARTLADQIKSVVREDGTFDLVDVRQHNLLEHDRSFTRLDFRHGDNYTMQPLMLQAMLDDANGGPISIKTLSKTYARRQKEHKESGGASFDLRMRMVSMLIAVGFVNASAVAEPTPQQVRVFYEEEKLEDWILQNPEPRTLRGLVWKAIRLQWHLIFS